MKSVKLTKQGVGVVTPVSAPMINVLEENLYTSQWRACVVDVSVLPCLTVGVGILIRKQEHTAWIIIIVNRL